MLNVLGSGYVVEYCIAVTNIRQREESYQIYTTDCLRAIAQSVGVIIHKRFYDVIHAQPVNHKKPEEIAADIIKRAGLKVIE